MYLVLFDGQVTANWLGRRRVWEHLKAYIGLSWDLELGRVFLKIRRVSVLGHNTKARSYIHVTKS